MTAIATVVGSLAAWLTWWPSPAVMVYRGRVTDDVTRAPIPRTKVSIDANPTPLTIYTDNEGIFVASLSREYIARDVRITMTVAGYEFYERSVIPREERLEDFRLRRAAAPTTPTSPSTPQSAPMTVPTTQGAPSTKDQSSGKPPDTSRDLTKSASAVREPAAVTRPTVPPRFINPNIAALGGRAVLIVDQRLGPDHAVTARVAKSVQAVDALFTPAFSSEGMFFRVHRGDLAPLRTMGIDDVQFVALGVKSARTASQVVAGETILRATVTIDVRVIFPSRGFTSDTLSVSEIGAGFDDERAIANATDKVVQTLIQKLAAM